MYYPVLLLCYLVKRHTKVPFEKGLFAKTDQIKKRPCGASRFHSVSPIYRSVADILL